jgi:hypothetical protein
MGYALFSYLEKYIENNIETIITSGPPQHLIGLN